MLERIRALKEADKIKNQFLGMAAHDLRSPISGINGMAELLLENVCGDLNDEQRELIEFIHEANMYMNGMVNDLLDISVIEAGKLLLLNSESNLMKCSEQRLRIHSAGAKKKSISFVSSLDDVRLFAFDERRIAQVLDNLLTNALKFSPTGESIEVTLVEDDGHALVCIRDNGLGVPPDEEDLLFQSFKKTSVQPTAGESSTGLGLPIVKKIVEAHNGRVWVESDFGKGAAFFFTLPF
jgi:signal transduction histidine kinase